MEAWSKVGSKLGFWFRRWVGGAGWLGGGWGLAAWLGWVGCLCGLLGRRCKRPVWAGKGFEAAVW